MRTPAALRAFPSRAAFLFQRLAPAILLVVPALVPTARGDDPSFPETILLSGPSGTVNSRDAQFQFEASEPATFTYSLDGAAPVGASSPLVLTGLAEGSHTFSVVATDVDGNEDQTPATRTWTVLVNPLTTPLAVRDGPVPGAGVTGSGVPAGASWLTFGVPSINDAGQVAFVGSFKTAFLFSGIFAGDALAPGLVIKKGTAAPGIRGATFGLLKDPVLANDGAVAFVATLGNAPGKSVVTMSNDSSLWYDADGPGPGAPVLIAREGMLGTGVAGGRWKAFTSVALNNETLAFTATLAVGSGSVTNANDAGLWIYRPVDGTLRLSLREGTLLDGKPVRTIATLAERPGSPGAGHWLGSDGSLVARVTRANASQVLVKVAADGSLATLVTTGVGAPLFPWGGGYAPVALGLPSLGGTEPGFRATLQKPGESPLYQTLFADQGNASFALVRADRAEVPGVPASFFTGFSDPVFNDQGAVGFVGSLGQIFGEQAVNLRNNTGVWVFAGDAVSSGSNAGYPTASGRLVAREGGLPPDVPALAVPTGVAAQPQWGSFTSLALPDGAVRPLFVAAMVNATIDPDTGQPTLPGPGGVTEVDDVGLWGTDSLGVLRLLAREGAPIGDKTIRSITVLSAVPGSAGQARSFTSNGYVIYRATFTDSTQALLRVQVP